MKVRKDRVIKTTNKRQWAGTQHFLQNSLCAQRRLWSDCADAQSDQSLRRAVYGWSRIQSVFPRTAKTDQTTRMRRLIRVFAGHTCVPAQHCETFNVLHMNYFGSAILFQSNLNGANILRPWKWILDTDSSSHWGFIIARGQEVNGIIYQRLTISQASRATVGGLCVHFLAVVLVGRSFFDITRQL